MNYKGLRRFYAERMEELFNMNSLDSYRVRTNNTLSLLVEMHDLSGSFLKGKIKDFTTVSSCVEELIDMLENDFCIIQYGDYSKNIFITKLKAFAKTKAGKGEGIDAHKIMFLTESCIVMNRGNYMPRLFDAIEKFLNDKTTVYDETSWMEALTKMEYYIKELSCEMLKADFSKSFVYDRAVNILNNTNQCANDATFENLYGKCKEEIINPQQQSRTFVFKLNLSTAFNGLESLDCVSESVPEDIIPLNIQTDPEYRNFFRTSRKNYFIIRQDKSETDTASALQHAKTTVVNYLDALQNGGGQLKMSLNKVAVVYIPSIPLYKRMSIGYRLDGSFQPSLGRLRKASERIEKVLKSDYVDTDTKDRLRAAMRHLRLANEENEIEQKYINYWLALEFMFSSPLNTESTFNRIKINLVNLLVCCYIKRNMTFVNKELKRVNVINQDELFWKKKDEDLKVLIAQLDSPLLSFRLSKMKSRIYGTAAKDKRKAYLKNNEKNLVRHIIRMYRLRNELVHEAAIKQDIHNVTSNLRYYLVFTINQLVDWLLSADAQQRYTGIAEMMYHYALLREHIEDDYDFDVIMGVGLSDGYIR